MRDLALNGLTLMRRGGGGVSLIPTTLQSTVVHNGETYTLDAARQVGVYACGTPFAIVPSGSASILSRSTAATTLFGFDVHGTMKNPIRQSPSWMQPTAHGWNGRVTAYSAGQKASFPISVTAGDIIVGQTSRTDDYVAESDGFGTGEYSVIHFVASAPAVGTFAPAAIGWSGRGAPQSYVVNVDTMLAGLPTYATAGMSVPPYASLAQYFCRPNPVIRFMDTDSQTPIGYEGIHPYQWGGPLGNYGRRSGSIAGAAFMGIVSDAYTTEQRKTLLSWMIRHGIDAIDPCIGDTIVSFNGGGHSQYAFIPEIFALKATGRTAEIANLATHDPQNPAVQPFKITSAMLADFTPHASVTKPFFARRRTIAAVSSLNISLPVTYDGFNSDPGRFAAAGYRIVRESDGQSALVTSPAFVTPSENNPVVMTIQAQTTPPLAVGNVVTFQPPYELRDGLYDWAIVGRAETVGRPGWNSYEPHLYGVSYRGTNFHSEEALAVRALDVYSAAMDGLEGYIWASAQASYPSETHVFPSPHDAVQVGASYPWAAQFWAAHAATLIPRPASVNLPTISGGPNVSDVLTCNVGTWLGGPTFTYQWQRTTDPEGATGWANVGGATNVTYTRPDTDVYRCIVTGTNGAGQWVATSGTSIPFAARGAAFDGTARLATSTLSPAPLGSNSGSLAFGFRNRAGTWTFGSTILDLRNVGGSSRLLVSTQTSGRLLFQVQAVDSGGALVSGASQYFTPTSTFNLNIYYFIHWSWDWDLGRYQIYVNNTLLTNTRPAIGTAVRYGFNNEPQVGCGVAATATAGSLLTGDLAHVWLSLSQSVDFSVAANRQKFMNAGAHVDLGPNGQLPTGGTPEYYFDGNGNLFNNKGTAGDPTRTGTITVSSPAPSY